MSEALRDPMELLAHTAWARRLAQALVSTDADDLCQETLLQAIRQPPGAHSPRAWLTTVMRNLRQTRFRAEARRQVREQAAAPPAPLPSPEESLARVELQRVLAERVAALEEPYRQTLLLRYFDELSAAQIAERLGLPAGTVRWRLKTALDRLRIDLDGQQPRWRREWALIAVRPAAKPAAAASGGLLFSVKAATAVAALVTLGTGWRALARGVSENPPPAALHARRQW